jgi:hypothetical protein
MFGTSFLLHGSFLNVQEVTLTDQLVKGGHETTHYMHPVVQ